MPRFIWISVIGILATLVFAGCPETSGESTTVSENPAPASGDETGGTAKAPASGNGTATAGGTRADNGAEPMSGDRVVDTLFTKRTAIQHEMETLKATPGSHAEQLEDAEKQLRDLEEEIRQLAKADPEGLKAQLDELAKVDPELAAEWMALADEASAAEAGEEPAEEKPVIALMGEPYAGDPKPISELRGQLKEIWEVEFTTTFGNFTVEVYPELAPIHGIRFLELVDGGFYDNQHIHRIAPGWVIQWGEIRDLANTAGLRPGQEPPPLERYKDRAHMVKNLKDEPVKFYTEQWTICFAKAGKDTASTQPFINLGDNRRLEGYDPPFSPFAAVVDGQDVLERLVESFQPAMEAAQEAMRADLTAKAAPAQYIEQQIHNDIAWGQYVGDNWDYFTMSLITEAKITKRPDGI